MEEHLVKIVIPLDGSTLRRSVLFDDEVVWARPVGPDLYKIESVPLYATGLNFWDVVRAASTANDVQLKFLEKSAASGYRTYRARMLDKNQATRDEDRKFLYDLLTSMQCEVEGDANTDIIAASIPPSKDPSLIERVFKEAENDGILELL